MDVTNNTGQSGEHNGMSFFFKLLFLNFGEGWKTVQNSLGMMACENL